MNGKTLIYREVREHIFATADGLLALFGTRLNTYGKIRLSLIKSAALHSLLNPSDHSYHEVSAEDEGQNKENDLLLQ